jgi:hypothetical protein
VGIAAMRVAALQSARMLPSQPGPLRPSTAPRPSG